MRHNMWCNITTCSYYTSSVPIHNWWPTITLPWKHLQCLLCVATITQHSCSWDGTIVSLTPVSWINKGGGKRMRSAERSTGSRSLTVTDLRTGNVHSQGIQHAWPQRELHLPQHLNLTADHWSWIRHFHFDSDHWSRRDRAQSADWTELTCLSLKHTQL